MIESIDDLSETLRNNSQVSLYGAGAVGKALANYCYVNNIGIDGIIEYIVSSRQVGENEYLGIPIVEIEQSNNIQTVIVTTKSHHHEAIRQNLCNRKIENCFYISDPVAEYLIKEFLNINLKNASLIPRKAIKYEVHLTEHCNLNCKGCFHFSPIAEEEYLDIDEYAKDCLRLSELYKGRASQILLLGGEPLLHPKLELFMQITRRLFKTAEIVIVTNGLLLTNIGQSFWDCCRENKIIIEPTKYPVSINYEFLEQIADINQVTLRYFNSGEDFKTLTRQPIDVDGNQDGIKNFYSCYRANACITLSHGRLYSCIFPAHIHHFIKAYNENMPDFLDDGIDIYKAESAKEISEYLTRPMKMCAYCDRKNVINGLPWGKSRRRKEEWTR